MEKMKIIFGINGGTLLQNQDSFVSIIKEGKIVVCSEKERFIRKVSRLLYKQVLEYHVANCMKKPFMAQ